MFLLQIIRFLLGYVRFAADGGYPEKFLNLAAFSGVRMWNIRKRGTAIYASTLKRSFHRLGTAAGKSGVTLRVVDRRGVPYILGRYRRRGGILVGFAVMLLIVWFCSSFVWTVQVTGNSATPTGEITEVLGDLGVRVGAFPLLLNVKDIEQQALVKLPGLAWLHIDIKGTSVVIKVKERVYPPEIAADMPCNIVASQTGQVIRIEPYEGQAMIRAGDTIEQGGLLVSGVIDCKNGVVRFVHARARVIALVNRELTVSIPYAQTVRVPTGGRQSISTLRLFSAEIPLYWSKPKGDSNRSVYDSWLTVFGVRLPIGVSTTVYEFVGCKQQTLNKTQAYEQAKKELAKEEAVQLSETQIKSRQLESKPGQSVYTLIGHYVCQQDIAVEQEIQIS